MKKHIIALLAISTLGLASCGIQKEAVADVPPPPPPVNPALEWQFKSQEISYIYKQNIHFAESIIKSSASSKEDKALFIDVPFLLFDREKTSEFFIETGVVDGFSLNELSRYSLELDSTIVNFLQESQERGWTIYLMAPQKESRIAKKLLSKKDIMIKECEFNSLPNFGRTADNLTLKETILRENTKYLILTTSLNELPPMLSKNLSETDADYKGIIVFPNPAFN
jgi:hypothetical protein